MFKRIASGFGIVLAIMFALWIGSALRERAQQKNWEARARADSIAVEQRKHELELAAADSIARIRAEQRDEIVRYVVVPGRTAPVPIDTVRRIVSACDAERATCAQQRAAAATVISDLKAAVALRDDMLNVKPPRLSAHLDVFYDPFNRSPIIRGSPALRVAGPLSIAGSASLSRADESSSDGARVEIGIGLRYTF